MKNKPDEGAEISSLNKIVEKSKDLLDQLEPTNESTKHVVSSGKPSPNKSNFKLTLLLAILALSSASIFSILFLIKILSNPMIENKFSPSAILNETPISHSTKLTGMVGYPSDAIPALAICSVNRISKAENCTEFPSSKRSYEYEINLSAPGEYWVYWSPQEWTMSGEKFWIGSCPPDRSGACSEFRVTKFNANPQIKSIPNIEVGRLNPASKLIFE
jgi:hypothetical protein